MWIIPHTYPFTATEMDNMYIEDLLFWLEGHNYISKSIKAGR